ncbi:MAG: sugar kinase [Nitrospinaceae bacterium]|nr:sugar kinase [Nitrospinaceae bacterium]NIR53563.1 sugar kinase [Nitrospinaceae bacterium]NIS83964.1 sugar kinase [Nitrospinaceae bacterium]NIT80773.1 sugar kinase [Nitrospinaceae bacterium]NIU43079.1 sugar kinase [Nitrospinaceae bacterium]
MAKSTVHPGRFEKAVLVTRKTHLEELIERFNTPAQARFYLEHAGEDFQPVETAHLHYHAVLSRVRECIPKSLKQQVIDRTYLPQFLFGDHDLVIPVGIDGLVVNTAKYLTTQPILAVNPDPATIDGILLPFHPDTVKPALDRAVRNEFQTRQVTLAEAALNDGQNLLAFNDLFVGARSHVSSRYHIQQGGRDEEHSSSGIIVSTGAGSTGWLQSIYTGAAGVIRALGGKVQPPPGGGRFPWDADRLVYAVREPFPSKTTQASLVYGVITPESPLELTSHMAENGAIFSDGVEQDYLSFNAGTTARIGIAARKARLMVPH